MPIEKARLGSAHAVTTPLWTIPEPCLEIGGLEGVDSRLQIFASAPDVFIPKLRIFLDELAHHPDAFGVL